MLPVRFGVIGGADIARRRMLPAMAASPDIEVAAVASRSSTKAADLAGRYGAQAVTGYAEILADDTVDAVYVPVPTAMHAEWVERALLAGKHVLAEKPLTTDPVCTHRLLELARGRGLVLQENVMFVHHRQHSVVHRLLADGAIGTLRTMHAAFAVPALSDDLIRYDPRLGGGALWEVGIYPVRAAVHLLGDGLTVLGAGLECSPGRRVETSGAALLRQDDGTMVQVTFGLEHAYRSMYELWGSEGRITVDRAFTPPADHLPRILLERASGAEQIQAEPDDQVANTLASFVAAVRADPAVSDRKGERDCLAQANLLAAIRRSARA